MKTVLSRFRLRLVWLVWLLALPLLFWSLRSTPLGEIQQVLTNLELNRLLILLALNVLILVIISTRWWLLLQSMDARVGFAQVFAYRLTGFGVSYFTPGPQFGGEPAQVLLLTRKNRVASVSAVSSVYLDKLLELLVNFFVLAGGLLLTLSTGLRNHPLQDWLWLPAAVLMLLPGAHLLAMWRGFLPISYLLHRIPVAQSPRPVIRRITTTVSDAESQIAVFLRRKPDILFVAILLSILSWLGMILEYALMARYLGIDLPFVPVFFAFILSRIAFLAPLPGGLGVLEASQVFAWQTLGLSAAAGLALSLLMRARDVLIGLTGIFLGVISLFRLSNVQSDQPIQTLKE